MNLAFRKYLCILICTSKALSLQGESPALSSSLQELKPIKIRC